MKKTLVFILFTILCLSNHALAIVRQTDFLKKEHGVLIFKPAQTSFLSLKSIHLEAARDTNEQISPKVLLQREKRGSAGSNFSFWSVIASVISLLLVFTLPKSAITAKENSFWAEPTSLGNFLIFIGLAGLALGFIIGVISLMTLKRSKNKKAKTKALIGVAPVLLLFLLYFFTAIFGR